MACLGTRIHTLTIACGSRFNCVQHPSIAAPFLSGATVIDCNGKRGFAQGDNTNTCAEHPEQPSFEFPATINRAGTSADARTMTGGDDDVQSYEVDPDSYVPCAVDALARGSLQRHYY